MRHTTRQGERQRRERTLPQPEAPAIMASGSRPGSLLTFISAVVAKSSTLSRNDSIEVVRLNKCTANMCDAPPVVAHCARYTIRFLCRKGLSTYKAAANNVPLLAWFGASKEIVDS